MARKSQDRLGRELGSARQGGTGPASGRASGEAGNLIREWVLAHGRRKKGKNGAKPEPA